MQYIKRPWITAVSLIISVVLWMHCSPDISDPATRIMGVVTDSLTNEPIDSAIIQLSDTVNTIVFYSNPQGRYSTGDFGYGLNLVFCRKEGYQSQSRVVSSSEDHATITGVDFQLSSD